MASDHHTRRYMTTPCRFPVHHKPKCTTFQVSRLGYKKNENKLCSLIFSIAVHYNTCVLYIDAPSVFCPSELDTRTLLRFPQGICLVDDEGSSSIIVLLRKALNGLRQSPQLFNKLLNELLTSCGLQRCEHEACIYKYYGADGWVLIGCEVDDLIVTGTNDKKIVELQKVSEN